MYCIGFPFTNCCLPSSFFCDRRPCGPCGPCGPTCGPCGPSCGPCGPSSCYAPCGPCCSPCCGPTKTRCEPLSAPIATVSCAFVYRNARFDHIMRLKHGGFYD